MYHFGCSFSAPEGLWQGKDSVTQDFNINVWRMKQLGFNAIRLPFRFTDFEVNPLQVKHQCQVAPAVSQPCSLSYICILALLRSLLFRRLPMLATTWSTSALTLVQAAETRY